MTALSDISAAIFDIDGTLLDSSPIWENLGERFLVGRGITPQPGLSDILAPMTIQESCRFLRENYPLNDSDDEINAALLELISGFYRCECALKPGAEELTALLARQGIKTVLATAGDKRLSAAALERLGIYDRFSGIVTCREFGGKSRPDIFLAAARAAEAEPKRCAVFEDSLTAVITAKSAGFLTAAVCDSSEPQQEKLRTAADLYRENLSGYCSAFAIASPRSSPV